MLEKLGLYDTVFGSLLLQPVADNKAIFDFRKYPDVPKQELEVFLKFIEGFEIDKVSQQSRAFDKVSEF